MGICRIIPLLAASVLLSCSPLLGQELRPGADGTDQAAKPDPKAEQQKLVAAAKAASLVLTATVVKVETLAQTNSIPPSVLMNVTIKDVQRLKGPKPEDLKLPPTFAYSGVAGRAFFPAADQKVLVVGDLVLARPIIGGPPTPVGQPRVVETKLRVVALALATDDNVAAVKKMLAPPADGQVK